MPRGDVLERLFGSEARVRLLRLFLRNPNEIFDLKTIAKRLKMQPKMFQHELKMLLDIGYIRRGRKKLPGFLLVRDFPYLNEMAELLASFAPVARSKLLNGVKNAGKVNLLVIAGGLLGHDTNHVDVFIVGDSLKKTKIERALAVLEVEVGKELMYAFMTTKEFQYRYGMYDRFVKDLFDNPHEVLINKLGI